MIKKNNFTREEFVNLENKVDFTLLDARATNADLEKMCDIAYKHSYYSVCVNPSNVSFVNGYIGKNFGGNLKVVCVVGFPLGSNTTSAKVFEIKEALQNGADEIDCVINIGKLKEGNFAYLKNEIKKLRQACKKNVLKLIIETCYLTENEIVKISKICAGFKVDFIKTSTGFGIGGATVKDIKMIYDTVKGSCKIKASGGIRNREFAVEFLNAGASRIGTSHII